MPFRFTLSPVLRLRENLERREYLTLQALYSESAEVRSDIRALEQVLAQARSQRASKLSEGMPAVLLQFELESEARVEHRRQTLLAKLADLQAKVKEQIEKYRQARQKREVLEELRRQQLQEYTREEATREQQAADELFLLRRIHRK
jgi:flagellar export protein FliJ